MASTGSSRGSERLSGLASECWGRVTVLAGLLGAVSHNLAMDGARDAVQKLMVELGQGVL